MPINKVKVSGVHGVEFETDFKTGKEELVGESKLGKTTVLNCIMACISGHYPGYGTSLPEGKVELTTDQGDIVMNGKKVVGGYNLKEGTDPSLIKYIIPGNFFSVKTTGEQRLLISKVLNIDSSVLENINEKIKDIKSKQKEFDTKKDQISDDYIRLEESLNKDKVEEPEEVEPLNNNSLEIINAYNLANNEIVSENNKIDSRNNLLDKDYQHVIDQASSFNSINISKIKKDINEINLRLQSYQSEAANANTLKDYNCGECGTLINVDNPETIKQKLRIKYAQESEQLKQLQQQLTSLESQREQEINKAQQNKPKHEDLETTLDMKISISEKAKYLGMEYIEGNTHEYKEYISKLNEYNNFVSKQNTIKEEMEVKENQLKELNDIDYSKDLKKLEKQKTDFNKKVEEKVKTTGLDIRLFKTLKNKSVKETFELYDKEGNSYSATSTGNQLFMEVLISKLFVDYFGIDFILFDKWESVGPNLRKEVIKQIGDLQIIATKVSKEKTIIVKKLST